MTAPALTSTIRTPSSLNSEGLDLKFVFSRDVPGHLREMLVLFKQANTESSRAALQSCCDELNRIGEQFDLNNWCEMVSAAHTAIGNTKNTYRELAPVLIRNLKRAQEQVLSGQASKIAIPKDLELLLPSSSSSSPLDVCFQLERPQTTVLQRQHKELVKQQAAAENKQEAVDELCSEEFGANYYAKLRDLLVAKDWKAADEETKARMLEVLNRQKEGWLRIEDVKEFPCLDLLNIDRMWVKYSDGKFGFSVQKKIWNSFGSPAKYDDDWEKFGVAVGWRTKGFLGIGAEWKSYSNLSFDSTIPRGYLPTTAFWFWSLGIRGFGLEGGGLGLSSLASRLVECGR